MVRNVVTFSSLTAIILFSGCGKTVGPTKTEGDPGLVEDVVFNTTALWSEKDKFDALFADGSTLSDSDRKKFQGISVVPENVVVEGNTATIDVTVTKYVNQEPQETPVKWEATKQGDAWLLTKAPLE